MMTVPPLRLHVTRRAIVAAASLLSALGARAALDIGERAPDFTASAAMAGRTFRLTLSEHLAKGPVVLYFFPAAFSEGCSIEAHSFAEAIAQYDALGATVIGVSGDDIEVLAKFSVQACSGKFTVASDPSLAIVKAFDAVMQTRPDFANRVSYLIAPSGAIVYGYVNLNPHRHVERTLAALRLWREQARKPAVAP